MIYDNIELLFRLLIAHALSDFIFQRSKWVENKEKRKIGSIYLYIHVLITFVLTYIALGSWQPLWIPLTIGISHLIIDGTKLYIKKTIWRFLIDQLLHIGVILFCWLQFTGQFSILGREINFGWNSSEILVYVAAYILVTMPTSILIYELTRKWDVEVNRNNSDKSLENAGKWIGIVERILVLTFTLLGKFEPIGFLMAAKSVFRFGDLTGATERKRTEYVLIGTLLSFAISVIVGLLTKQIIKIL